MTSGEKTLSNVISLFHVPFDFGVRYKERVFVVIPIIQEAEPAATYLNCLINLPIQFTKKLIVVLYHSSFNFHLIFTKHCFGLNSTGIRISRSDSII